MVSAPRRDAQRAHGRLVCAPPPPWRPQRLEQGSREGGGSRGAGSASLRAAVLRACPVGALGEGRGVRSSSRGTLLFPPAPTLPAGLWTGGAQAACCGREPHPVASPQPPGPEVSVVAAWFPSGTLRGRLAGSQRALENIQNISDFIPTQALVVGGRSPRPAPGMQGRRGAPMPVQRAGAEVPPARTARTRTKRWGFAALAFWGKRRTRGLMLRGPHTGASRAGPAGAACASGENLPCLAGGRRPRACAFLCSLEPGQLLNAIFKSDISK